MLERIQVSDVPAIYIDLRKNLTKTSNATCNVSIVLRYIELAVAAKPDVTALRNLGVLNGKLMLTCDPADQPVVEIRTLIHTTECRVHVQSAVAEQIVIDMFHNQTEFMVRKTSPWVGVHYKLRIVPHPPTAGSEIIPAGLGLHMPVKKVWFHYNILFHKKHVR